MAFNLDSLLNWLIPTIVVIVFLAIFYTKLKKYLDPMFFWFIGLFHKGASKVREQEYTTVYRYG